MARYNLANMYIANRDRAENSGGGSDPELENRVTALETTVDGDETQDPPVVGLVDVVGDLENTVEDLDATVNGDPTATPPIPSLLSQAGNVKMSLLWSNSSPTSAFAAQDVTLSSSDYDLLIINSHYRVDIEAGRVYGYPVIATNNSGFRLFAANDSGSDHNGRNGTVSGTTVSFTAGTNTNYMVPISIYGIKLLSLT